MTLVEKARRRATTVTTLRKQAANRKIKADFERRKEIYIQRIEKKIMKLAEDGQYEYTFDTVPYGRSCLSEDEEMFVAIAKHFGKQGFSIKYDGRNKKGASKYVKETLYPNHWIKRDWNLPLWYTANLTISWEN